AGHPQGLRPHQPQCPMDLLRQARDQRGRPGAAGAIRQAQQDRGRSEAMISVIACSLGIVTMLALWVLAWWVWRHPDAAIGGQRYRRPIWQNEPTPGPRPVLAPPPSWLFEGGGVPV